MSDLNKAMSDATRHCKRFEQLCREDKVTWTREANKPNIYRGTVVAMGDKNEFYVLVAQHGDQFLGSLVPPEAMVIALHGEFAKFCFEAAEAYMAKKN